jgi:hypothetical protein
MLEALLIMSIVYACMYMPLRGKDFEGLTPAQQVRVEKSFSQYMKTKKGKQTPDMKIEEYLLVLQKQGLAFLIVTIVIVPIYLLAIFMLYPQILAGY